MNKRRAIEVLVVFLLLAAAVTYYIIRKPVYDRLEVIAAAPSITVSLDLGTGTGTYTTTTGSQPLRITSTAPTIGQIANSSTSSALVVGRVAGGPLGFVPADVQFNDNTISVFWPVTTPFVRQVTLLSSPYTGPGTYTGTFSNPNYNFTTTMVIGEDFPCPSGTLSIDLSNPASPEVSYTTSCGYSGTYTANDKIIPTISTPNYTIATFSALPNDTGYIREISVEYTGNLVVSVNSEVWISVPYTGPGEYSAKILDTTVSVTLGSSFSDASCAGQAEGVIEDTDRYGTIFPTLVHRACNNGRVVKCVNQVYGDGSGCDNALIQSCGEDKDNCNNLGRNCKEEGGCNTEDCINENIAIYSGKFKVPQGASYEGPNQTYTC